MKCTFQLHDMFSTKSRWEVISFTWNQSRAPCQEVTGIETAIQTKVYKNTRDRNKTTILHWFFWVFVFWHINTSFCPSPFAIFMIFGTQRWWCLWFALLHLHLCVISHEHLSDTLSKVLRSRCVFGRISRLAATVDSHRCEKKDCCSKISRMMMCAFASTLSGVDSTNCCCVTSFYQVGCHGDGRRLWCTIHSEETNLYLSLHGHPGGIVSRANVVTGDRLKACFWFTPSVYRGH